MDCIITKKIFKVLLLSGQSIAFDILLLSYISDKLSIKAASYNQFAFF